MTQMPLDLWSSKDASFSFDGVFAAALDALTANIAILAPDGSIIAVNRAWRSYATTNGWETKTFGVGENYLEICRRADNPYAARAYSGIRRVLAGDLATFAMEYPMSALRGQENWYLMRVAPFITAHLRGAVVSHEPVTGRKRLESALHQQARLRAALEKEQELNAAKSEVMERLAHEFRTPLTIINNANDLVQRYGERLPPERRLKQMHMIRLQVMRMSRMLDDIIHVLRGENGVLEAVPSVIDAAALCRELIDEIDMATFSSHVLSLTLEGSLGSVCLDEKLLHLILVNLLNNAIKYSPPGSQVRLCVTRQDKAVKFKVIDQGRGIPEDAAAQIFEAFYRGPNTVGIKGLGLGLTIVQRAVEAQRGMITFESTPNEGTTFEVILPIQCCSADDPVPTA